MTSRQKKPLISNFPRKVFKLRKNSNSKERERKSSTPKFRKNTPTSGKTISKSRSKSREKKETKEKETLRSVSPNTRNPLGTKIKLFNIVNDKFVEVS